MNRKLIVLRYIFESKFNSSVDDIADSGHTLKEVADSYLERGCIVTTAVLYSKEGSVIEPDIVWQSIPIDAPWIIFPWEL